MCDREIMLVLWFPESIVNAAMTGIRAIQHLYRVHPKLSPDLMGSSASPPPPPLAFLLELCLVCSKDMKTQTQKVSFLLS